MKTVFSILALSAAVSLAACSTDNKGNMTWNHPNDTSTVANNPNLQRNADNTVVDTSSAYNLHNSRGSDKLPGITIAPEDRAFIVDASAAGNYEVEAGKLALSNSDDQRVKDLAQHMIDDHTQANGQLLLLGKSRNVTVSAATNMDQQNMLNKLRGLKGTDFDREYITQQQAAHRDAIAKFSAEANDSQNSEIRQFASDTLPTLRGHLNMLTSNDMNKMSDNPNAVGMQR